MKDLLAGIDGSQNNLKMIRGMNIGFMANLMELNASRVVSQMDLTGPLSGSEERLGTLAMFDKLGKLCSPH